MAEWMSNKGLCSFLAGDRAMQMDLIGKVQGLNAAETFFHELNEEEKNEKTYGALLNCYVREGLADKSISLMQKMEELGFVTSTLTFNDLMCLFNRTGQLEKIPEVFSLMKKKGLHPDNYSYRICMNAFGAKSDLKNMEMLLEEMKAVPHLKMDWTTYSTVASLYMKFGLKEKAIFYLKKLEDKTFRNAVAYNHLISHYASLGNKDEMKRFWALQKVACKKQLNRDYINMLGALVKLNELEEAKNLVEEWNASCKFYDFRVPNVLVIGYCKNRLIEKAEALIEGIISKGKTPSPNSYGIIASAHLDEGNMEKSSEFLKKALAVKGENPDWRPKPLLVSKILNWVRDKGDVELEEVFVGSLKTVGKIDDTKLEDEEINEDDFVLPEAERIS